jgi:hypothetical protein
MMARNTTQSRFECAFEGCGASYHADEGATINIGREFFAERIHQEPRLTKVSAENRDADLPGNPQSTGWVQGSLPVASC